ncbi:MAG: hypothetical protein D6765_03125 [Bacteroidetes bacterium]|nr:MAG: hypothetical protein D6765_03125 [Bacteroidota bacterium]
MDLRQKVGQIEKKLLLLSEKWRSLQLENQQLKTDLASKGKQVQALKENLENTRQVLSNLLKEETESTQEWKQQIERSILELDKCLEGMQNP